MKGHIEKTSIHLLIICLRYVILKSPSGRMMIHIQFSFAKRPIARANQAASFIFFPVFFVHSLMDIAYCFSMFGL